MAAGRAEGQRFRREKTLTFDEPHEAMTRFEPWSSENVHDRPIFMSDNNGFDWQLINGCFHHLVGRNPFGFSSQNLGSLYTGRVKDTSPQLPASAPEATYASLRRRREGEC